MVSRQDNGSTVTSGQNHGASIGVVHPGFPFPHFLKNRDGGRILDRHAFDDTSELRQGSRLILQKMCRLCDGGTRDNETATGGGQTSHHPSVGLRLVGVDGRDERSGIKYYDRRGCGHG